MNCPNCHQPVEPGAVFCGNCGQSLGPAAAMPAAPGVPVPLSVAPQVVGPPMAPASAMPSPGVIQPQMVTAPQPVVSPGAAQVVPPVPGAFQPVTAAPAAPVAAVPPGFMPPSPVTPLQPGSPIAQVMNNTPVAPVVSGWQNPQPVVAGFGGQAAYAYAAPGAHPAHDPKAIIALIAGIVAIPASFFLPVIIGLILAIVGIVLGTLAHSQPKSKLKMIAVIVSIVGLLCAVAGFAIIAEHVSKDKTTSSNSASSAPSASSNVSTSCFSFSFPEKLSSRVDGCDVDAYNGASEDASSDVYRINTTYASGATGSDITTGSSKLIKEDILNAFPDATVVSEGVTTFSGQPAYQVTAKSASKNVQIIEMLVYHDSPQANIIDMVNAKVGGGTPDLSHLESNWVWKN